MTNKRPRGRPKGSGIDDAPHLDAVADVLIRKPNLKKTPAIAGVVQEAFLECNWPAAERRLLRKWNKTADKRLEAAKERRDEERRSLRIARTMPGGAAAEIARMFSIAREQQVGGAAAEIARTFSRVGELQVQVSGAAAEIARTFSRVGELQEMVDTPAIRFARKQAKLTQQMRDAIDTPLLRHIKEQTEMFNRAFGRF